jgi:hypothetical protein
LGHAHERYDGARDDDRLETDHAEHPFDDFGFGLCESGFVAVLARVASNSANRLSWSAMVSAALRALPSEAPASLNAS